MQTLPTTLVDFFLRFRCAPGSPRGWDISRRRASVLYLAFLPSYGAHTGSPRTLPSSTPWFLPLPPAYTCHLCRLLLYTRAAPHNVDWFTAGSGSSGLPLPTFARYCYYARANALNSGVVTPIAVPCARNAAFPSRFAQKRAGLNRRFVVGFFPSSGLCQFCRLLPALPYAFYLFCLPHRSASACLVIICCPVLPA